MALKAMTLGEQVEYVSDLDPAKHVKRIPVDPTDPSKGEIESGEYVDEGATVFLISPLDVFLMAHIYDNANMLSGKQGSDEVGIHTRMNQTNIDAVRLGLKGLRNFKDAKGNDIVFATVKASYNGREYEVASDDVLKRLGVQLIQELGGKIKELSEVSADDAKN